MNDDKYFQNITPRERAIFEGAITMGALFHQYIGTPVSIKTAKSLERAIEKSMELQPCIKKVKVKIDRTMLDEALNEYQYLSLTGNMLDMKVTSEYGKVRIIVRMRYVEELHYPLMYVESVDEVLKKS
jgi:dihydroneopterin aldolase